MRIGLMTTTPKMHKSGYWNIRRQKQEAWKRYIKLSSEKFKVMTTLKISVKDEDSK